MEKRGKGVRVDQGRKSRSEGVKKGRIIKPSRRIRKRMRIKTIIKQMINTALIPRSRMRRKSIRNLPKRLRI